MIEHIYSPVTPIELKTIQLKEVGYAYDHQTEDNFKVGPINLTLEQGKLYYLIGGNGSGKTTLAKILTLLYPHDSGQILINQTPLKKADHSAVQQNIGMIFNDFFLFDQLFGLEFTPALEKKINRLIHELGVAHKVHFTGQGFSTSELSTGQRKRLALIELILSTKQFLVFDEWAANQDKEFKDVFYRSILPDLKNENKITLVITHDDHYFEEADVLIYMDSGKIVKVESHD